MCRCWTQCIRSLVNFIIYLESPYVLDYNYIVIPLPTGFFVSAYFNGEGVQEFLTLHYSSATTQQRRRPSSSSFLQQEKKAFFFFFFAAREEGLLLLLFCSKRRRPSSSSFLQQKKKAFFFFLFLCYTVAQLQRSKEKGLLFLSLFLLHYSATKKKAFFFFFFAAEEKEEEPLTLKP